MLMSIIKLAAVTTFLKYKRYFKTNHFNYNYKATESSISTQLICSHRFGSYDYFYYVHF